MKRIKVFRIITSNYCIPAHLDNTLKRVPEKYQLYILGDKASIYAENYPEVVFINIPLKRNFSILNDFISFFLLVYYFLLEKPQVVHSLMTKAGLMTSIVGFLTCRPQRFHTFTGQIWANNHGVKRQVYKLIDVVICRLNTFCLTDSPSQSQFLFNNGIDLKGKKIPCLLSGSLSGVDITKMNGENVSLGAIQKMQEFKLNKSDNVIGYIARKSIDKGCLDMLNIFKILNKKDPNIKLLFVGPDESNGQINDFYKKNQDLKKHIIDLGFVHNHEVFLKICKLICLPSHREGFGSIIIDAASMGVPAVGYKIPGLVDSILGNAGYLIQLGEVEEFASKVFELLNSHELYSTFSANARKNTYELFSADLLNHELYKIYESIK